MISSAIVYINVCATWEINDREIFKEGYYSIEVPKEKANSFIEAVNKKAGDFKDLVMDVLYQDAWGKSLRTSGETPVDAEFVEASLEKPKNRVIKNSASLIGFLKAQNLIN